MGEVERLPVQHSTAREHVTLSVDALAKHLALAEDLGYRRGVHHAKIADIERNRLILSHEATYETRADLYAAFWHATARGRGKA